MHTKSLLVFATTVLARPNIVAREDGPTAAAKFGWDNLVQEDDFNGTAVSDLWDLYDGPGHDGKGIRSPDAVSVADGILTIDGTPDGTTGGMTWGNGQLYGRWEARARYTAGTPAYHQVLLLWPDKEDWPVGGEVDYSEVTDGPRKKLNFFLHYGEDNSQEDDATEIDMTQWRSYAVEWTAEHVLGFVDGEEFFRSETPEANPPRPMHATIQLDWFPEDGEEGTGKMEVDWIRQYAI